ncbi:MAG: DNA-formamidopyrimidine glycosylase family protein [Anaerolineae bacterium]
MPELPDLEAIKAVLTERILGQPIEAVEVRLPLMVRTLTADDFAASLTGRHFTAVDRRGKHLILTLDSGLFLVINPMLMGRLSYVPRGEKVRAKTHVVIRLADGMDLRYVDQKTMGKVYLTDDLARIPAFSEQGPEALDIGPDEFRARLKRHPGEIKGILTNAAFVAGIGNAYADEILWRARLYPFRKRPSLSDDEIATLYAAMRATLLDAIEVVRGRMGEQTDREVRDFLQVHGKGGQVCPRCGAPISEITANQRITNFCRQCQPGALVDTWRRHT